MEKSHPAKCSGLLTLSVLAIALSACSSWQIPATQGDPKNAVAYGYQPLDPAPVAIVPQPSTGTVTAEHILKALPDETMRMAIGKVEANGTITYGPASVSAANGSYVVTVDYIKSNTQPIYVKRQASSDNKTITVTTLSSRLGADASVPVYIGVGLRLTASLTTTQAGINLGNLILIGAAANANQLSGTLVIQTLGVSGENISTAIPIPTDISAASIQNAIVAIGTMKAKLYDNKTAIQPRVVGVYNSIGGGTETVNGVISSVLESPPTLTVPVR